MSTWIIRDPNKPDTQVTAHRFVSQDGFVQFLDTENNIVALVVPAPGLVIAPKSAQATPVAALLTEVPPAELVPPCGQFWTSAIALDEGRPSQGPCILPTGHPGDHVPPVRETRGAARGAYAELVV